MLHMRVNLCVCLVYWSFVFVQSIGWVLSHVVINLPVQFAWEGAKKADGHHTAHHCLCAWHKIHMGLHSLRLGSFPILDSAKEVMDDVKKWLNWFCTRSFMITSMSHPHT
jgi:hypothetical protein